MILIMGSLTLSSGSPFPKVSTWGMMSYQTDSKLGWKYQNFLLPPCSFIVPFIPALFSKAPSSVLSWLILSLAHRPPLKVKSCMYLVSTKGFYTFWMASRKVIFFVYYSVFVSLFGWEWFLTSFYILIQRRIFKQFKNTNRKLDTVNQKLSSNNEFNNI